MFRWLYFCGTILGTFRSFRKSFKLLLLFPPHIYTLITHIYRQGNGNPLHYACLENPWSDAVHGVAKNQTRLSGWAFIQPISNPKSILSFFFFWWEISLFIPVMWKSMLQDFVNSWKAFSASCWLWMHFPCKQFWDAWRSCSRLVRGQVCMADEATKSIISIGNNSLFENAIAH